MENHFLNYKNSKLHFVKAGNGSETLLFFHGFGQDHSVYLPIIQSLAKDYTLFIFDLYFHGQSEYEGEVPLEKRHWKEIIHLFLTRFNIKNFSLTGFSLGGKFALATFEAFPENCKSIFLIAPDGIATSYWYSFATYPILARKFFKSLINNYERFASITTFLNKYKLADKGLIRFADYQMNSEAKRKRVYYSWVVFRHLSFNKKKLISLIARYQVSIVIMAGAYDNVIDINQLKKFISRVPSGQLKIVECGHTGLLTAPNIHLLFSNQ